ncbi:DNA polymerase III subunit psi [Psychrobacter pacificensis]|uniref:DNA polymerase III subunit psi n=1 Tax=Psychrobacter pacificensis TaxID=112002 RepID=UPI001CC0257F|nr:DNA polymerase III subunit psi [Psychrobacter pacificensis]MBZ1391342.1 DNA polymerase III subunit psi [Psychrobacter pacificensis]
MSDIQDPLNVLQRRVQQRQILAMMGINQWVRPESSTVNIADITIDSVEHSNTGSIDTESASAGAAIETVVQPTSGYDTNDSYSSNHDDVNNDAHGLGIHEQAATEQSPVTYSFDSMGNEISATSDAPRLHNSPDIESNQTAAFFIDEVVQSTTAPIAPQQLSQSSHNSDSVNDDSLKKVAPFSLQGGRYGDWVILVDIQALNSDSQKLWNNITQALSMTHETTSFPICAGMDTVELANASLAGYVFRIGLREEIKVAALTVLPEGLQHPNLMTVPTLDDMIADSDAKRQLWERISH